VGQVAALAAVFGEPPSYLVDRGKGQPVLDDEVMEALADETANVILRGSARLPERKEDRPRDSAGFRKPTRRL